MAESETREIRGKKFRVVPLPSVSDFYAGIEWALAENRRKNFSEESIPRRKREWSQFVLCFAALLLNLPLEERSALVEKIKEKNATVPATPAPWEKRSEDAKPVSAKAPMPAKRQTPRFPELERPEHGIRLSEIEIPPWHPQLYFSPPPSKRFAASLRNGYSMAVNVHEGKAELLDNRGYLRVARMMGLEHPPLEITRTSFVDVRMLQSFFLVRGELSEWEQYKLFVGMLRHTKVKTLAKWLDWNERCLRSFLDLGGRIENRNPADELLEKMVRKKIRLRNAI